MFLINFFINYLINLKKKCINVKQKSHVGIAMRKRKTEREKKSEKSEKLMHAFEF
jgi:hypothetical protein